MPHVTIQYTANLDPDADIGALCRTLAEIIVAQRDGAGGRVFPIGGTRVLAYPTPHFAVADGAPDRAFVYLNVRIATGRERGDGRGVEHAQRPSNSGCRLLCLASNTGAPSSICSVMPTGLLAKIAAKCERTAAIIASPVAFTRAGSRPGAMRTLR